MGAGESYERVAGGGEQSVEDDEVGAVAETVGEVGREDYDEEGEEVGGCGERLRDEDCVAHFVDHSGEEDGHGGEGHVGEEEHECCKVGLWVRDCGEHIVEVEAGLGWRIIWVFFLAQTETCNFLLATSEVGCAAWTIGDGVPCYDCHQDAGETFDKEEQPP